MEPLYEAMLKPETIEALGKVVIGLMAAMGTLVSTIASTAAAFYTWKNRYELDRLYAKTYRPNEDGTPGPMRRHPKFMVKMFERKK